MMPDRDLGSRVYVLESKQEEFDRRQREQEERQRIQEDLINKLANNTAVMNSTLEMLTNKVLPKVDEIEQKVVTNTMITKAAMWVFGALTTAGLAAVVAFI